MAAADPKPEEAIAHVNPQRPAVSAEEPPPNVVDLLKVTRPSLRIIFEQGDCSVRDLAEF